MIVKKMKQPIIYAILLVFALGVLGCTPAQDSQAEQTIQTTSTVSGTEELILNEDELSEIGMKGDSLAQLRELGISADNGSDCKTEKYQTDESSSVTEYSICSYVIESLNNTEVIVELKKFTNQHDLNGSYQYNSLHYRSSEGLISQDDFGDQSRFYVNNENDYGGEFNDPNVYYYTLYTTKNDYLIHVTSKGTIKEARDSIAKIGQKILSKFE